MPGSLAAERTATLRHPVREQMPPPNAQSPQAQPDAAKPVKPFLLCMSCNAEFPSGSAAECPNCHVSLSLVRRCPGCQRVLGAQHFRCPYCSTGFVPEEQPVSEGPVALPHQDTQKLSTRQIATAAGTIALFVVAIALIVYRIQKMAPKPHLTIGQTYALHQTTLYRQPAMSAPPIGELQPGTVVDITDTPFDAVGNRWFEIASQSVMGYVPAGDVAPPKGKDSENGFILLRHSLLSLDDPNVVLTQAAAAVDYYAKAFPQSPHLDELTWLLAERTRAIAERYSGQRPLLERAREMYAKLVDSKSEFAERARQALEQLPPPGRGGGSGPSSGSWTKRDNSLHLTIVGGSLTPSHSKPTRGRGAPVRTLTVISRTSLDVRLPEQVKLSPELTFQGEIDADITVNGETAVPKGSACHVKVARVAGRSSSTWVMLRLTSVVVDGLTYHVSAAAVRVKSPADSGKGRGSALSPGTRLQFRLDAPLVVTRS